MSQLRDKEQYDALLPFGTTFAHLHCILSSVAGSERSLIMPTDLEAASARKRAEQAQAQTETTIMLVWLVVYLGMLVLVFEVFGQ